MNDQKILTIDVTHLESFLQKGSKWLFTQDAENAIISLLQLKEQVEMIESTMKRVILASSATLGPNFRGIGGDRVNALCYPTGKKYEITDKDKAKKFIKVEIKESPDTEKIDEYIQKHGDVPDGVKELTRKDIISFRPNEDGKREIQTAIQNKLQSAELLVEGNDQ